MPIYYVYMLRCKDRSLYTGYTVNIVDRIKIHQAGKGSKYTRSRLPVSCVYWETCLDKSQALKREKAIKNLTKAEKEQLLTAFQESQHQDE